MIGHIYFVRRAAGRVLRYKIGYSRDVARRIKELQTGNDEVLELIGVASGSPKLERQVHKALGAHKVLGEWFADNNVVGEFISESLAFGITGALATVHDRNLAHEWHADSPSKRFYLCRKKKGLTYGDEAY